MSLFPPYAVRLISRSALPDAPVRAEPVRPVRPRWSIRSWWCRLGARRRLTARTA